MFFFLRVCVVGDVEEASRQILSPDAITPCIEKLQGTCVPQYIACAFFSCCGILLAWLGVFTVRDYFKVTNTVEVRDVRDISNGLGSSTSMENLSKSKSSMRVFAKNVEKNIMQSSFYIELSPGGKWFWYRYHLMFFTEIGLQLLRCFVVYNAYAKTSAAQTVVQIALDIHITKIIYNVGKTILQKSYKMY